MPLAFRGPAEALDVSEDTSFNVAYLTYNSVGSLVRANTGARFRSSIKSMRHSLRLVTPEWHRVIIEQTAAIARVEVNSMQATTCTRA